MVCGGGLTFAFGSLASVYQTRPVALDGGAVLGVCAYIILRPRTPCLMGMESTLHRVGSVGFHKIRTNSEMKTLV